ncbi:MAG: hypothetical protein EBW71_09750, partial [Betaproteobacteria bacterium]|nr:hypothetical protein [Betaproteobacteria bacterium]
MIKRGILYNLLRAYPVRSSSLTAKPLETRFSRLLMRQNDRREPHGFRLFALALRSLQAELGGQVPREKDCFAIHA